MTQQSPDNADEPPSLERELNVTAETGAAVIARYAKMAPAGPASIMFDGGQCSASARRHLKRVQSYARYWTQ